MSSTRVTIEFTGRVELDTQGWGNECRLDQIKRQAQDEVSCWVIMVKKGSLEPVPVNFIKMAVTEVIIPIKD